MSFALGPVVQLGVFDPLLGPHSYLFDRALHRIPVEARGLHESVTKLHGVRCQLVQGVGIGRERRTRIGEDI